jgi:zinc protease
MPNSPGQIRCPRSRTTVLALLLLSAAFAPPPVAAAALLVPHQTFTLPNGLQVILHEDHSVPIVTVNTWYHVGASDESPGRTGFAHLFEHIMFMGSQHVPTGAIDDLLEASGAENNASTNQDRTNYYEDGPIGALPLMLYLDSDRLGFLLPEITKEKVDIQRSVVQNERRERYENAPYGLAQENILARVFPASHPYHWPTIGSMADLDSATIEDVRNFFRAYYTPNNASLVIAGDITPASARQLVTTWFGDIPAGPPVKRKPVPTFKLSDDVYATLEDRVQLPRVYDTWHSVKAYAADDAALDALTQILANGKSSRLYKRLVYELQIATQVTSFQDGGRLDGKLEIYATARPEHNLDEIQRVIDEEVKKLADAPPTTRELERVQNSIEAQFLDGLEQIGGNNGKANQLNYYSYFVGKPDDFEADLDRYRKLSPADIQRVARDYLVDAHRVVMSVVPQGKTELAVGKGVTP